ncbi:hypothetical protein DFH46_000871 [Clostridium beijerinckii]|nr:hypothetical protein [Clostridium beijerinckii]NRW38298.1 hypothetical protein [Clostridium beijerinckii]
MEQIWEKLYKEAMNVINPHEISSTMWVGSVASAVLTKKEVFIQEFVLTQIVH